MASTTLRSETAHLSEVIAAVAFALRNGASDSTDRQFIELMMRRLLRDRYGSADHAELRTRIESLLDGAGVEPLSAAYPASLRRSPDGTYVN